MNNQYSSCKYCNKKLTKTKCPNDSQDDFWLNILFELWSLSVYVIFLLLSLINKNIQKN